MSDAAMTNTTLILLGLSVCFHVVAIWFISRRLSELERNERASRVSMVGFATLQAELAKRLATLHEHVGGDTR